MASDLGTICEHGEPAMRHSHSEFHCQSVVMRHDTPVASSRNSWGGNIAKKTPDVACHSAKRPICRQNSAPQLAQNSDRYVRSRRSGLVETLSSQDRTGSNESVHSDTPMSRAQRCPACSARAPYDEDGSTCGRQSPLGPRPKPASRRNPDHLQDGAERKPDTRRRTSSRRSVETGPTEGGTKHPGIEGACSPRPRPSDRLSISNSRSKSATESCKDVYGEKEIARRGGSISKTSSSPMDFNEDSETVLNTKRGQNQRRVDRRSWGYGASTPRAKQNSERLRSEGGSLPKALKTRTSVLDLDKMLQDAHLSGADKAKSEDEVQLERQWLEADRVWLVHKTGFTSAMLLPADGGGSSDGTVKIKLDSGEILDVEEEDVEKANPTQQDRVEDLALLRYVNESSALHVLRQRFAGHLPHTYAGPSLIVINPTQHLPIYSEKLIHMFKGCKQEDLPPHVYSAAQIAYRDLLASRRDQSILFLGRSGSGKTCSLQHCLHYLIGAAGSINNILTVEKLSAINILLQSFANCRTLLNTNASRYMQITTLDFDPSGVIGSASIQVLLFEKSRLVRRPEGEPTFHIFYQLLAGVEAQLRNELSLQNLTEPNPYMTPLQKLLPSPEDRQQAANKFGCVQQAFQSIGASEEETKAVYCILAAIYHLGIAGASKGPHNKFQFTRPAPAQRAASLLGTTTEELARCIFTAGGTSTLSRSTSFRVNSALDKTGYHAADTNTSVTEALEAFLVGLYSDVLNAVVSLINRSLSSNVRTMFSLMLLDAPGFQNPSSCGRQTGASFEDFCSNYVQERFQLFYHENTLTAPQDRYAQENIDCDFDLVTSSPAAMVSLFDQAPQQALVRAPSTDVKNSEKKGLLWILDEQAMFPGASEDSFLERVFAQHGEQQVRKDTLLRKGSLGQTFILNHNQGTAPVQYNATGWLRLCRDNPISKNSTILLQGSKQPAISELFGSIKGALGGFVSGSVAGMEGSTTLRRVGSMRRTFMSGTAALKRKSISIQVKFQVDSVMEMLRKTQPHFVFCFLPQHTAGLCELREKSSVDDVQVNIPLLRLQLRGFEILDALRLHRQGFPEFMQFGEFLQKFHSAAGTLSRSMSDMDEKQAVLQVLDNLDVDRLNYRVGLSKVFFRQGVLSQLEAGRDEKLTGIITQLQALCRGYLSRKKTDRLRVKHLAVRCIQRNVQKYMLIREWPWWKLYTKVKPILNVHRTEEELLEAQAELEAMKTKVEKLEKERNEYKAACDKLETRLTEVTADLVEENTASTQASELLEAESAERMRLEKELKDLQAKYVPLKRQNEKLQMEVMQTRVWQAQSVEEELEEDVDSRDVSVYKERCEKLLRELQMIKKQFQQQHEEDMEQELQARKVLEKRLQEAVEEAEEQRRQVQVAKKKAQRLAGEMQDIKLHLEEQMARNNELERKQRRFDSELSMAQEDMKEEKHLREKLQKERDTLLAEKYTLDQSILSLKMDHESASEKADRLEKELNDILVSGKDNSEVVSLKRAKHELELKLREQEEELDDQAGQIQQLEQTKLRLEMNIEKLKQQHTRELEDKEEDLEEMRTKTQKKLRQLEAQLEEEYDEKRRVMEEKQNLERQLNDMGARAPSHDRDTEKRLRRNLKKTKALLADAGTMLAKQKNLDSAKQQIAQLRNQLDDAAFSASSAQKAKKRMELEIQDLHQQIEELSRAKQEVEARNMTLLREKADVQTQLEENEDDMAEVMKKYKAAVQKQSVDQITLNDQLQQIEELSRERDELRQQVADLSARVQGYEEGSVDKHAVKRLETKIRDLESRLELEQSQRQRSETQLSRYKEQLEKGASERDDLVTAKTSAEEVCKRAQKQLRELRDELAEAQKREMEAVHKSKEQEREVEALEEELAQCRADLKLAFKRISDLQAALEEELDSDEDSLQLGDSDFDDSEDEGNDDLDTYLGNHHAAGKGNGMGQTAGSSDKIKMQIGENGTAEA
ncbi:unconventional myosin-XVIIIa-like isoform X3 [Pomacea canaliculata]|uniref:unconventional myosin-XVIIIa-like isoform X3 n=1 Tax=Pomacea canaliculata TaxID=400727 RepID=UPI000D72D8A4|nr:unconventional myosin-XVIIIa-like isoform X3 [Pomacea canaliculata]